MIIKKLHYDVLVEVFFTPQEVELLNYCSRAHYDSYCVKVGCEIGELGAKENGFIAQLRLFTSDVTWTTKQIDTALKIIENNPHYLAVSLRSDLIKAFRGAQARWKELSS